MKDIILCTSKTCTNVDCWKNIKELSEDILIPKVNYDFSTNCENYTSVVPTKDLTE
jgi:hypothetical protein